MTEEKVEQKFKKNDKYNKFLFTTKHICES